MAYTVLSLPNRGVPFLSAAYLVCVNLKYFVILAYVRRKSYVPFAAVASLLPLRKHAYSNILKILPPKNENFQIKNSDIFLISAQKHRLWVLVRTASIFFLFLLKNIDCGYSLEPHR